MLSLNPIVNRAFELAYSGRFSSFPEVRVQLSAEGFNTKAINECFATFVERRTLVRAMEGRKPVEAPFHWITK
jgi:hypothetical protein